MSIPWTGQKGRKLYFDISLRLTQRRQSVAVTPFRAGLNGDRFGALMQPVQACPATSNAPQERAQQSECVAWFKPNGTSPTAVAINVFFVGPTVGSGVVTLLPSYGGIAAGDSAVFGTIGTTRHFSVTVEKGFAGALTAAVNGTVYVQRQHSIEV
jgi:hypothetical protein